MIFFITDRWHAICALCCLMTTIFIIGCSRKVVTPEQVQTPSLIGTVVEIDDHSNAVTDFEKTAMAEHGWTLGDTLEATFETGQTIQLKFVENYGDVPEGDYLGRFSTSTGNFKIAINMGYFAKDLGVKLQTKVTLRKVKAAP